MKIKMKDVVNGADALQRLMANPFPVKLSYKLSRILTDADRELKTFEKLRFDLIKKHGEYQKETDIWQVGAENTAAYNAEYGELLDVGISVWGERIKLDALGSISISPADLFFLSWLLDCGEDEEKPVESTAATA